MYDYEQNPDSYTPPKQHIGMETAAMILGILGLLGSSCCYLAIPFGAIGMILALLSKGRQEHMSSRAKTGLWLSVGSLVLTSALTGYTLYQYRDLFSSAEFREKMQDYLEYYYHTEESENIDDFLEDFFNDGSDGSSSYDGTSPYDGSSPYDGTSPYDGSSPYDGTSPYDGSSPYDGTSPYDGSSPYEDSSPYDGTFPYVDNPNGGYWGTSPYGGSQDNGTSVMPGPEV